MRLTLMLLYVMALARSTAFADLIPYPGPGSDAVLVSEQGNGFGNITELADAQTRGYEGVCTGPTNTTCTAPALTDSGTGVVLVTNDTSKHSHVPISLASLGITDSSTAASQVVLVFNGNQTGRANAITLDQLALSFWGLTGTSYSLLYSIVTTLTPEAILTNQSGQGGDGYGYALDPTEAAAVQTHLTGYSLANIYLGGGFSAGCDDTHFSGCSAPANSGADDLKVAKILAPTSVPEPVSILGFGTILLLLGSRLRRNRA